jgi:uncharacterized iron-regulated protein
MQTACASSPPTKIAANEIYTGTGLRAVTLPQLMQNVRPGDVIIVSEEHGFAPHHAHQRDLLAALATAWPQTPVNVGMEFFEYPDQPAINDFLQGRLLENVFLQQIKWGKIDFGLYRQQVLFPRQVGGVTLGLNAPHTLAHRLSMVGDPKLLTSAEQALLPPQFQRGNSKYLQRFAEIMGQQHPGTDAELQKMFWAQSLWDDTMAWQTSLFMRAHPDQILVIIVGDFHAAYGGGLPDRLRARGVQQVTVISQVNVTHQNAWSRYKAVAADPRWGARADLVWTAEQ